MNYHLTAYSIGKWKDNTKACRQNVAINADENPVTVHFDAGCGTAVDLISGNMHDFGGGSELPPYSVQYWKMER